MDHHDFPDCDGMLCLIYLLMYERLILRQGIDWVVMGY
jgi:hypothetical protein